MDSSELYALDASIRTKSQSLARLVHKRITHTVKQRYPDARTIRLSYDPTALVWRVVRVSVGHSRVTRHIQDFDDLSAVFGHAAAQLQDDVNHYVLLAGARLHMIKRRKHEDRADYSIVLHPKID